MSAIIVYIVGVVLDQTGSCAGQSHPGSHLAAHTVDAARKVAGLATSGLVPQGRRRLHVRLHNVSTTTPFLKYRWIYG